MIRCELSSILADHDGSGYVVAPAGYGKTHLIAESTRQSDRRQLILTHTYAGVNALRNKMRLLGVSNKLFHIDTIASWTLRLSLSYRTTSGWEHERPVDNEQWTALYDACAHLLEHGFVRRIVHASFGGVYVDEYQDCSTAQHGIVVKLARDLPCRVLGDPLQGIFDFRGQAPVDWGRDVETNFKCLGALEVPHRWKQAGRDDLGKWLHNARKCLEREQPIDLNADRTDVVRVVLSRADPQALHRNQSNTCRYFQCDRADTVIAIHKGSQQYKAKCHTLSRNLSGKFSSIEEVEGKDLFSFIRKVESANTNAGRLREVVKFAKRCMTTVVQSLPTATVRGESAKIRTNTRNPKAAHQANDYLDDPTSASMFNFLSAVKETAGVEVTRADLFHRALGVLRKHVLHPDLSLTKAAEKYQSEFRYKGRPVRRRRLIGTTLLVKGLEFDHAIVLDAASLSKKELYVALTRGAQSLTIVSTDPVLNPAD